MPICRRRSQIDPFFGCRCVGVDLRSTPTWPSSFGKGRLRRMAQCPRGRIVPDIGPDAGQLAFAPDYAFKVTPLPDRFPRRVPHLIDPTSGKTLKGSDNLRYGMTAGCVGHPTQLDNSMEMIRHHDHLIENDVRVMIRQLEPASLNDLTDCTRQDRLVPDPAKQGFPTVGDNGYEIAARLGIVSAWKADLSAGLESHSQEWRVVG